MLRSVHHISVLPLAPPQGEDSFACSSVRSLQWETVLHKLLHCDSFLQATVLHQLPPCGPFPWCVVLREQPAPSMDPVGSQVLPADLLHMDSSLKGSTDPARSLFQHRLATGPQPPSGTHLLWRGVLHSLQVHLCSTVDLLGLSTTHI